MRLKIKGKLILSFTLIIVLVMTIIYLTIITTVSNLIVESLEQQLESNLYTGMEIIDKTYPGNWHIKDDVLYKGNANMENNDIVDDIGNLINGTVTIFKNDTRVSTNVRVDGKRAVGTKVSDIVVETVIENGEIYIGEAVVVDELYQTAYKPIRNEDNDIIGIWYVGVHKSNLISKIKLFEYKIIAVMLSALLVIFLLTNLLANSINKPLKYIIKQAKAISNGDLSIEMDEKYIKSKDEFGILANAFFDITVVLKNVVEEISGVVKATTYGKITTRINNEKYEGSYKQVMNGVNKMMDTFEEHLDNVPVSTILVDKEFNLTHANKAASNIVKMNKKDIIGMKCYNMLKAGICNSEKCAAKLAISNNSMEIIETTAGPAHLSLQCAPYRDDSGEIIGVVECALDLTETKLAQQESEKQAEAVKKQIEVAEKRAKFQNAETEKLVKSLTKLANGDLNINEEVAESDDDTIIIALTYSTIYENLNKSTSVIKSYIDEISNNLEEMSNKNFTVGIDRQYVGDFAPIKEGINLIVESFNNVLADINIAADQVASGAGQVSDGSNELSQGATEQASSIEELTSSITEVAAQTKQNASSADEANNLAIEAKTDAEEGNNQMQEMLTSMDEINEASNNIAKIIKVIDEIAFQTNILALNAAVEAARAGQHGKGFAVVAEEVRNLAQRSANAAQETTDLIEGSMKKVEIGTEIANKTAEALEKIVDGVTKAADLVGQIAQASNEQATGITQINQGIEQVAKVTQTNSATSEESAAASEELSSQAGLLKEMVSQFNIKNKSNSQTVKALPGKVQLDEAAVTLDKPQINLTDDEFGKY